MADPRAAPWYPVAAYLYVLRLDGPGLAWEYLRRHPDYQRDWLRRRGDAASGWGLRLLEDPGLDARDAQPAWLPGHEVLQLHPDADPPPDAPGFRFWNLPGRKQLFHDGRCLRLVARWPGASVCLTIAPGLADGVPSVCAPRVGARPCTRCRVLAGGFGPTGACADALPAALVSPRPTAAALLEVHTLRALDATLAGASLRDIAVGLFGAAAVARDWHADGGLRSRVRRLVRRGRALMRVGYRGLLARRAGIGQGRCAACAKRP